jgi:hypothetical protein
MNISNSTLTMKDFIQWGLLIITAAFFFSGLNSKVDNIDKKVDGIITTTDKRDEKREIYDKSIQNQVNTTTLQLELLKQDFQRFKDKK